MTSKNNINNNNRRTPIRENSSNNNNNLIKNNLLEPSLHLVQSGGSALLLRFFESQFFNVHLAISYLKTYHDSIGITYYLINRLDQFPSKHVEFYWPQLCHLLISRPTESLALESFIIKKSQLSTHLAIKTLWYLQASLSDLSSNPNTPNFIVCRRAFNRVQSIIFSDPLLEISTQPPLLDPRIHKPAPLTSNPTHHSSSNHPSTSGKHTQKHAQNHFSAFKPCKIGERALSTSVGIGLALAGLALPQLANEFGHLPIEQSQHCDQSLTIYSSPKSKNADDSNNNSESEDEESDQKPPPLRRYHSHLSSNSFQHAPSETHPRSRLAPRIQLSLNHSNPSTHKPVHTSRSFHQPSPINFSFSSDSQSQLNLNQSNVQPFSSPSGSSTPIWSSPEPLSKPANRNPSENQNISFSLMTPGILTAPLSSDDHSLTSSSNTSHVFHSSSRNSFQSSSYSHDLPVMPSYSTHSNTISIASNSSPRVHPPSAISQSAPSLPDALSKFKRDRRFNHTNTSITHRNGHHQNHPTSPIESLSSALSIDPSQIPVGLLNQVLKSQSMRSQLELITSLQDIATRLVAVPKKARLSALRAELTVLNHSLPKGCCLGMYCDGDTCDDDHDPNKKLDTTNLETQTVGGPEASTPKRRKCHQRIVRISPSESVVLNSADRAPFLIHVEVLEDHLDFDPNRRSNHEDLRKAIKESTISINNQKDSNKECRDVYPDRTAESIAQPQSIPSVTGPNQSIKSHPGAPRTSPLPSALAESLKHLHLASADPTPSIDACNINHSSGNNRKNSDLHHQSILITQPRSSSGFIESNDHQPGLLFSSPPSHHQHHGKRAPSFDFPEISTNFPAPEEEIDLVEQVYGRDRKSSQSSDSESSEFRYPYQSSGSSHLPLGWRNKALDEEAWKRAESFRKGDKQTQRTHTDLSRTNLPSDSKSLLRSMSSPSSSSKQIESSSLTNSYKSPSSPKSTTCPRPMITLDEYAERMKMAAIMLAQLSASQQPPQSLSMTPSSAAGMVVGGAIGLGAGFVGVTVGAGLGAVVSRRLVGNGQTIITSPIGRKDYNGNQSSTTAQNVNGQGSSGLLAKLDIRNADGKNNKTGAIRNYDDGSSSSRMSPGSVPKQKLLTPQQSQAIKDKIMAEMMLLEEERMTRTTLDQIDYDYSSGRSKLRLPTSHQEEQKGTKGNRQVIEEENLADEEVVMKAVNEDDPSGKMLSESWEKKRNRIRLSSPYGHLSNWNLFSIIVKTGTDLRQEQIIIQLIHEFGRIWNEENCNVWVKYYGILVTGESTGLMETIVDAISIHSLKKSAYSKLSSIKQKQNASKSHNNNNHNNNHNSNQQQQTTSKTTGLPNYSLFDHYVDTYGPPTGKTYKKAQENFMRSLVSYSIITYILQVKDRHNGNILIDKEGHIIHIDFGFVLSNSPGSIGFEMSPFKLNQDYLQVLNPPDSFISIIDGQRHFFNDNDENNLHFFDTHHHHHRMDNARNQTNNLNQFNAFVDLFKISFKKIRKHAERIITIVELMQVESKLPCFGGGKNNIGENVIKNLRERFQLNLNSEEKLNDFLDKLILSSINSVFTKLYDSFQYFSQGVL